MVVTSATLDKILNKVGQWVTIKVESGTTVNDYGDVTTTWQTSSGIGYVQVLTERDESVRAGILNLGDAIGYFKFNTDAGSIVAIGSNVLVQEPNTGLWYKNMGDPIMPVLSGNVLIRQINLTRSI